METYLRDQVRAALDIENFRNACFLGERLIASQPTEENTVLLARCYIRNRQDYKAVRLLTAGKALRHRASDGGIRLSLTGRLLLAQALYRMNELNRAEHVITKTQPSRIQEKYMGAEFHFLSGMICRRTRRRDEALSHFANAIECNPLHWAAFEELCRYGKTSFVMVHFDRMKRVIKGNRSEEEICPIPVPVMASRPPEVICDEHMVVDSPEPSYRESQMRTPQNSPAPLLQSEPSPHTPEDMIRPGMAQFGEPRMNEGYTVFGGATCSSSSANRPLTRQMLRQQENTASRRRPTQAVTPDRQNGKFQRVADPSGPVSEDAHSEIHSLPKPDQNDDSSMSIESENPVEVQSQQQHISVDSVGDTFKLIYLLNKGVYALSVFDLDRAAQIFVSRLPERQRETAWVKGKLGCVYMQSSKFQEAKSAFNRARQLDPAHFEDMDVYSSMLYLMDEATELSQLATELRKLDRMAPETWCVVGNLHSSLREPTHALAAFQRAIQMNPHRSYSYSLCGHVYIELEEFEKALACFREACTLDPRHHAAWYGMGMVHYLSQKYDQAAENFSHAVTINPSHSVFRLRYGMSLMHLKRPQAAIEQFEKATRLDKKNKDAFLQKGKLHYEMGAYLRAKEALEGAVRASNTDPEVQLQLGLTLKKLGNIHKAQEAFYRGLDMNPGSIIKANIRAALEKINQSDDDQLRKY